MANYNWASTPSSVNPELIQMAKATPVRQPSAGSERYLADLQQGRKQSGATEEQIKQLMQKGYTYGLCQALATNVFVFPLRIWVVDNSGSMMKPDGHRIVETTNKDAVVAVTCTRWEEIEECVNYHAHMAALLNAPSVFNLLNNPGALVGSQRFSIAERGQEFVQEDLRAATYLMRKVRPSGVTPLTDHIFEIQASIKLMAPQLEQEGKKAVIVLATDGLPSDERGMSGPQASNQFVQALRLLEGLPVWIVIRLCTDDDDVVNFYNELDDQLELSLEVLDDFYAEAKEVFEYNKWLNYSLPLHRMRELGFYDRVFDLIDERPLTESEIREFCALLFGEDKFDGVPDPALDLMGFIGEIERIMKNENLQYNPIKKRMLPWVDTKALSVAFGGASECECIIL